MKYYTIFLFIFSFYSCGVFDDPSDPLNGSDSSQDFTEADEENLVSFIEGAKLFKEVNQHVLSLALQYPAIGSGIISEDEVKVRSNACPDIFPDPNQKSSYPQEFIVDLDSGGNGCTPLGSKVKYKGKVSVNIISPALQQDGEFIIKSSGLLIGKALGQKIDKLEIRHKFRSNNGRNTVFDTEIITMEYTNYTGTSNQKTIVENVKRGLTTYSDVNEDSNLNNLSSVFDDEVFFEFETMDIVNEGKELRLMEATKGKLFFNLLCSCPTGGEFTIKNPGGIKVDFNRNNNCTDGSYKVGSLDFALNCD